MASPTLQAEIDSFDYRAYLKLKGFSDEEIPETLSEESKQKIYARAYSQYIADEMKQVQEETPGGMSKKAALKEVEERELEQYPHRRTLFGYWDEELTADDVYKPEMLFPVLKEKYGIDVTDPYFDVEKLGDKANISINEVVRQYAPQIINDKTARNVPELEGLKRPGFIKEFQDRNAILNGDTVGAFLSEYRKKAADEAVLEDQQQRSTSQWLSELGSAAVTQGKNMIYGYMPDLALWAAQGARIPFTDIKLGSDASPYTVEGDTFLNKKLIELASWSGRKHAEVLKQAEKENFRPRYIESPPEYLRQGEWGKFLGSTFEQLVLNGASTVQNVLTPLTMAFGNRIITPVTTLIGAGIGAGPGAVIGNRIGNVLTGGAVAGLMLAGGLMTASDVTADLHEMGIHDPSKVDLYLEHVATAVALDWTSTIIEAGLLGGGKFLAAPFKNRSAIAAEKAAQDAAIRANGLNPNVVAQLAGKQLLRNQAALRQANSRIWQKAVRGAGGWAVLRRGALGTAEEGWSETHQEAINMDLVNKMTSTTQEGNWSPGAASLIWPWAWEQAKREGGYRFPEKMVKHRLETAGFIGAVMGGGLVSGGTAINEWSRAKRQAAEDRELTVTDKDGNTYIVQQAQRQRNRAARIFEDMQAKGLGINAQTIVGVGLNQVAGISVANFNGVTGTGTSATDAFIDLSRRANAGRKNIDINTLTAVNGGHEVTLNNGEKVTFLGTNSEQMLRDLVTLHNSDNHPMVINGGATIEYDPANRKPYTITRPDGTKVKAETLYDNYALYNFSTHADSGLIMDTILRRTGSQSAESNIGIDITQTGTFSFTGSEQAIRDSIDNSNGRLILLDPAKTKKGSTARVRKNGAIKSDTMMVLDAEDGIIYTVKMKGGKNNSNVHVNVIARDLGGKKLTLDPDVARQTIRSAADPNALRKNIRLKSPKAGITVQSEQVAGQTQWNFKVGQVEEIARLTGATVVSPAQTASNYVEFMVPGYRRNADGTMEEFGTTFSLRIDDNGKVWADTMGQSIEIEGINEYTQLVPGDTNIYAHVLQGGKYTTAGIDTNTGAITMRRVAPNGAEVELVLGRRGNIESYRIVSNPQRAQDMIDAAIDERNSLTSTQQATQQQMGQIVDPDLTSYTSQEIAAAGFDPMTINNILKSVLQRNIAGIIWGPLVSFNSIRDTLVTQFGLPMERFMVQQLVAETGRVNGWSIRNINDEEIAFFNNDTQGLRDFKAFMTDDVINDMFALDRVAPYLLEQAMKKGTTNLTTTEYKAAIEKFLSYHDAVFRPREDTSQMIRSTERKAQIRKSLDIYIDEIEAGRVVLPNIAAVRALYGDLIQNGYGIWNPNTRKFATDANGNRIFDTNRGRLANRITSWSYPESTPQPLYKLGNEFYSEDELVSAAREQKNLDLLTDDVINDMVDRRIQGMQERPLDVAARGNRRYIDILNNIIFEETRKLLDPRYNSIDELINYYGGNLTRRRRWRRMDNGEYKYIGKDDNLYTDLDIVRNPALFDVITFDENQQPHQSHIWFGGNVYSEIYQLNDSFGATLWYQETPLRDYRGKKRPQVDYDRAIYRMVQRLRMIDILMAYHNNYDVNDLINDRIIDEDNEADFPAPVRSDIEAEIKQELNNAVSNAGTIMDFFDIYGPQLQQRFSIVDSSNGIFAGRTGNSTYLGVDTFLTREEVAEYINKNGLSSTQTVEAYYVFYNNDFSAIESFNTMAQADSLMNELRRPDKVDLIDITERVDERMQAEEARVGQQNARKEALRKQRAAAAAGAQQQAATGGTPTPSFAPVNYADYLTRLFGADSFVSLGAKVELYQNGLNTHHTEKLVQDTYINENLTGPDGESDRDLTDPNKSLDRELNMTVGKLWRDAKNRNLIIIHKTINDYLNAVPRARQPILRGIFKPIVARNLKKLQTDVTLAEIDAEIATHTQDELDAIIHEKGRVQGYYDAPNKKIHLVEEAIPWTMADRVFYHELAVHCANNLTKEISDRWVQIAEYLKKHRNDKTELGRAIQAIERNRKGELRQHDVNQWGYWEEVCAYFVADYLNRIGLAARIKAVFRDWFRTTGVINKKGDITPADIIRFARASANAVVSNPKQLGTENKSGMKAGDQFSMMAASFHTDADIMQEEYEAVEQHYDNAHYGDAFGMVHDRTTGIFNESNLNGFRWTLVRTPIFKKWFGDWETRGLKSSKIVDGNGEPLLVFHNTKYDEQAYDSPFIGLNGNFGQSGKSVYSNMTENPYAEKFRGNMVAQTFINMRRPLHMHNYVETSRYFEALGYEESAHRLDLRKLLGSVRNDDWVRAVITGIEDYAADPEPNTSFADFMLLNDNLILTAIPLTTMEEAHRFLNGLFEAATTPANSTLTNEPVLNANTVEEWQANLDDDETRAHWQQAADIFETRLKPYENQMLRLAYNPDGYFTHYEQTHVDLSISTREHIKDVLSAVDQRYYSFGERDMIDFRQALMDTHAEISQLPESSLSNDELFVGMVNMSMHNLRMDELHWRLGEDLDFVTSPAYPVPTAQNLLKEHNRELATSLKSAMMRDGYDGILGSEDILVMHPDQSKDVLEFKRLYQEKSYNPTQGLRENPVENRVMELLNDDIKRDAKALGVPAVRLRSEYRSIYRAFREENPWSESNLDEYQWILTRTPSFKENFGDWQNDVTSDMVLDTNGEPLRTAQGFIHGTGIVDVGENNYFSIAWAGSSSRFDRFSTDYVMSQTGMNVDGWGLYFTDDQLSAQTYALPTYGFIIDGIRYTGGETSDGNFGYIGENGNEIFSWGPIYRALRELEYTSREDAVRYFEKTIEFYSPSSSDGTIAAEQIQRAKIAINFLRKTNIEVIPTEGNMYKVDIPEKNEMFDTTLLVSEQSEYVRNALLNFLNEHEDKISVTGVDIESLKERIADKSDVTSLSGSYLFNLFRGAFDSPKALSLALNKVGIKGTIHKNHQGKQDKRDFVVFSDEAVKILERYPFPRGIASPATELYTPSEDEITRYFSMGNRVATEEELVNYIQEIEQENPDENGYFSLGSRRSRSTWETEDVHYGPTVRPGMSETYFGLPAVSVIPQEMRDNFGVRFVESAEEAERVHQQYEAAMSKQSDYTGPVYQNLLARRSVLYEDNGSYIVAPRKAVQATGNIFVISHFAPKGMKDGVRMVKNLATGPMKVIAAVPPYQGNMLRKAGFDFAGQTVQPFHGELVLKDVYTSQSVTQEEKEELFRHYTAGRSQAEMDALIAKAKRISGKKDGDNGYFSIVGRAGSRMPAANASPDPITEYIPYERAQEFYGTGEGSMIWGPGTYIQLPLPEGTDRTNVAATPVVSAANYRRWWKGKASLKLTDEQLAEQTEYQERIRELEEKKNQLKSQYDLHVANIDAIYVKPILESFHGTVKFYLDLDGKEDINMGINEFYDEEGNHYGLPNILHTDIKYKGENIDLTSFDRLVKQFGIEEIKRAFLQSGSYGFLKSIPKPLTKSTFYEVTKDKEEREKLLNALVSIYGKEKAAKELDKLEGKYNMSMGNYKPVFDDKGYITDIVLMSDEERESKEWRLNSFEFLAYIKNGEFHLLHINDENDLRAFNYLNRLNRDVRKILRPHISQFGLYKSADHVHTFDALSIMLDIQRVNRIIDDFYNTLFDLEKSEKDLNNSISNLKNKLLDLENRADREYYGSMNLITVPNYDEMIFDPDHLGAQSMYVQERMLWLVEDYYKLGAFSDEFYNELMADLRNNARIDEPFANFNSSSWSTRQLLLKLGAAIAKYNGDTSMYADSNTYTKVLLDYGIKGLRYVGSHDKHAAVIFDGRDVDVVENVLPAQKDLSLEEVRRVYEHVRPNEPESSENVWDYYFSVASRQMQASLSPEQREFEETIYNSNGEIQEVSNYDLGYFSISPPVAKSNWKAPDELDAEEYITLYRATVMRDGEYYSPMAEVLAGEPRPIALGEWEYSVEHPELIVTEKGKEKFKLIKRDGGTVSADYAPYIHSSLSPLNDQFTTAYRRPIVILEIQVPKSEETAGYHAERAKKPVGWSKWKSGPVASKLGNVREVMLSRYAKPTRPLTNIEVAERIREINPELFTGGEKAIPIPINVVTPGLLRELVRLGATVGEPSGFKTQYPAQRAEKERLSQFAEDIRQNGITSPYFTDRPATGGYFSMSSVSPQGLQKQADVQYPDASQEILGYFSLTEKRRARYRGDLERAAQEEREGKLQLLKRVRPDLTPDFIESVLDELERYGQDADKEKMVLHWTIRGRIIPYVDRDLIDEARAIVKQKKMPIKTVLTYESPMALIDEYKRNQYKPSGEPIDPESVPEIKKDTKIDHGDGIVSYEVQDDKQGQEAMRRIVDSHFGKKWSKWCLLYTNTNGLTEHSWEMWKEYSGLPKRAAFKDGRLISFMGVTGNQVGIYSIEQIIDELHQMVEDDIEDDVDLAMTKYGLTEDDADLISEVSDMNDLFLEVRRFTTFIMNLGNKDYYRNNIMYFDMLIDSLASLINSNYFNENISNIRSRYPEIEDILRRFETSVPEEDTDRVDYYFRLLELENPEMIKRWKDFINYFYTGFETTLDGKRSDVRRIIDYIYYVDEDDDLAVIRDRDGELVDLRELNYNTDNEFHYQNGEFISRGNGKKEAWWDKNDDSHPNLDWARDDRTLTRIDAGLPTNDDEDLIGPDDQGLFFSMMPDLNETTNYDTDIYDRTEIVGSNGAYKLANGKVFIDVDEVGEENVARVLLYALVRESPEALNNATMRRMLANIQAWENSQDPRLRGLYADIRMDMMNEHVPDDALLSYALRRLMAEGIDPRNAQDDVSPEGVFNTIINEAPAIIGQVSGISTGKVNPTAADVLTVVNAISGVENVPVQTAVPSMGITETEMQAARTRPVPFMEAIMAEVKEIVDTYDFASFDYINGKPHLVLGGQGGLVFNLTENPLHTKNVIDQIMEKLTDFGNLDTMTGDGEMNPFKQIMEKLGNNSQLGTQATEADVNKFISENIPDYIADRIQVVYNETPEFTDLFGDKYGGLYRPNMADRKVIYVRAYGRNLSDVINSIVYLTSGFGWTMWNNSDFAPLMDELWTVLKGNIQRDMPTYYARLGGKTPSASQKSALISAYLASKSTSIYELAEFSKTSNVAPGDEQKMRDIAKKVKDEITKVEANMAASFARDFGTNKELVEEYVEKLLRMTMAPFYGKGLWLAYDVDYDTYQANNPDASDRYKDFGHVMVFANEFGSVYKPIPLNEDAITNQIMLEKYRRMKPFWKDVHLQIWRNWHPPMKHIGDTVLGIENSIMLARAWKAVTTEWGSALKKIYQTVSSFDDTLVRKGIDTEDFDRAKGYVQELRDRGIKDKKLLEDAEIIDIFLRYGRQKMLQNVAQIRALIRTSAIEAENWMRKENVREKEIQRMHMEMDQFANRFVTDWEHRSYRAYSEEGQNDLQEMYNIVNGHTPAGMPTGVGWFASVANKSQSELTQLEQDKMRGAVDEKAYAAKRRELKRNIRLYERLDALYQWTNQNVMSSLPKPTSLQYRRAFADVPRQVNDQMKQEIQNVMTLVSSEKKRGNLGKMDLIPAVRKRKLDENNPHHVLYMNFLDQVKNPAMSMLYNLDQQGKVLEKLMFNLKFGRSILETGMGTMKGSREHVNLGVDNLSWMETGTLLRYIKIDPFFLDEIAHEQELQLKIRDDVWNSYINIIKQNFTILNWRMLVSNYVGNFSNLFATGHFFRWGNYAKARAIRKDKFTSLFSNDSRKALQTLKGKQALANAQAALREYDEEIAEYKEEMERLNIWGSGTTTVNLIGYGHGGVEKLSQLMSSFFESVGATDDVGSRSWNRRVNRIMNYARELYGFGDEWVKPWTYINNRAVMMAKYRAQENWAQYAGREDSPEAVDADNRIREMARRDAALLTMKETTTWELSPDVARQISSRASRVIAPDFLLHGFQMARIMAVNVGRTRECAEEVARLRLKPALTEDEKIYLSLVTNELVRRTVGQAVMLWIGAEAAAYGGSILPGIVGSMLAFLRGEGDDDDEKRKKRQGRKKDEPAEMTPGDHAGLSMLCNWVSQVSDLYSPLMWVPGSVGDKFYAINFQRMNAALTFLPVRPPTNDPTILQRMMHVMLELADFRSDPLTVQIANNLRGKDRYGNDMTKSQILGEMLNYTTPQGLHQARNIALGLKDLALGTENIGWEERKKNRHLSIFDAAGIKVRQYSVNDIMENVGRTISKFESEQENPYKRKFFQQLQRNLDANQSDIASLVADIVEVNRKEMERISYAMDAFRLLRLDRQTMIKALSGSRDRGTSNLGQKEIALLLAGRDVFTERLKTNLETKIKNLEKIGEGSNMTDTERRKIRDNYRTAHRMISEALR